MIYTPPNLEISPLTYSPTISEIKDKVQVVKDTFPNKDVRNLVTEQLGTSRDEMRVMNNIKGALMAY